jgi:imidazolonepropionase-like amidohydrolase
MNAAAALGLAESLGSIAPGKFAAIIAIKVDPSTHVDQLGQTGKVSLVMKEGQVKVK